MADANLLDLGKAFEAGKVKALGGAKIALVKSAGRPALRVAMGASSGAVEGAEAAPAPAATGATAELGGVELAAPSGSWDLSRHTHLVVDIRNVGPLPVPAHCRAENPGAEGGKLNCVFDVGSVLPGGSGIQPGRNGQVWVELCRKKPDWVKVDLCGMIGRPWSDSPTDQRPERAIDPAHVVKIMVFVALEPAAARPAQSAEPAGEYAFEIAAVRAVGEHLAPTKLLADPAKFFPCIDELGQYIHADWPGKTRSPADLPRNRQREEKDLASHAGPAGWDQYGGWVAGPALEATGWFRVARHEGKWWLVDPEGRLFFSHGVDCVNWREGDTPVEDREHYFRGLPPAEGPFRDCYPRLAHPALMGHYKGRQPLCFSLGQANLMRKYGDDWRAAYAAVSHRRLRSWGLNTIANWSEPAIYSQSKTPYTVNVRFGGKLLEGSQGYWGKFRDVFDESFPAEVARAVAEQTCASAVDPWCLGYFVDNEISWGTDAVSLAAAALASPAGQTAKRVFVADLRARYATIDKLNAAWTAGHASWEALLASEQAPDPARAHDDLAAFHAKTAEMYFKVVQDAMTQAAPHQLYLGCRFAWYNAPAVAAAARHCDVVSFNIYQRSVANFRMPVAADVPLIIGEYHFGTLDRGMFHTGLVPVPDQAHRAAAYREYVQGLLRHPQFVGGHWFKYMDEPTTGRPSDEENYQVGLVDIADTPYAETIQAVRETAAGMYEIRMNQ